MKHSPFHAWCMLACVALFATGAGAEPESRGPRSWCGSQREFLYDDPGNTFPPQQCTWRARREAEFFHECIDRAPRPRHARRWIDFARSCGFEISDECVPGAVAVSRNGRFGHVGVCSANLGNGRFRIVDMNNDGQAKAACRDGDIVKTSLYRFIVPPSQTTATPAKHEQVTAATSTQPDPAELASEPAPDGTLTLATAD